MDVKTGFKTSEFWITAVVSIAAAVIGILAARGLVSSEEQSLYLALVQSLAVVVAPLVIALVTGKYIDSRAEVKKSANGKKAK